MIALRTIITTNQPYIFNTKKNLYSLKLIQLTIKLLNNAQGKISVARVTWNAITGDYLKKFAERMFCHKLCICMAVPLNAVSCEPSDFPSEWTISDKRHKQTADF